MIDEKDFGKRLAEAISEKGFAQNEFAQLVGSTPGSIWNYQTGKSWPSLSLAIKMADALEISLDDLVGRDQFAGHMNKQNLRHEQVALINVLEEVKKVSPDIYKIGCKSMKQSFCALLNQHYSAHEPQALYPSGEMTKVSEDSAPYVAE